MSPLLKAGLVLLCPLCVSAPVQALPIQINEIHYDNVGTDSGEFVELVGAAGSVLDGWRLVLYNGNNGNPYDSLGLSGTLSDDTGSGFGFHVVDLPANGLQNGAADGIALIDAAGLLVEFISYEGVLTALSGPAAGQPSLDIGVAESNSTPIGWSLQASGVLGVPTDVAWQAAQPATPGALNLSQRMLADVSLPAVSSLLLLGGVLLRGRLMSTA